MWRHNDQQYGQYFIAYNVQFLGTVALMFAKELYLKGSDIKWTFTGVTLFSAAVFFFIFLRQRKILNHSHELIKIYVSNHASYAHDILPAKGDLKGLWPTSKTMMAFIGGSSLVLITLIWSGVPESSRDGPGKTASEKKVTPAISARRKPDQIVRSPVAITKSASAPVD